MNQSFLSAEVSIESNEIRVYDIDQFSSAVPFLIDVGLETMMVVDRKHSTMYVVREHKRESRTIHPRGTIVRTATSFKRL